jgi:hypothetical protein
MVTTGSAGEAWLEVEAEALLDMLGVEGLAEAGDGGGGGAGWGSSAAPVPRRRLEHLRSPLRLVKFPIDIFVKPPGSDRDPNQGI